MKIGGVLQLLIAFWILLTFVRSADTQTDKDKANARRLAELHAQRTRQQALLQAARVSKGHSSYDYTEQKFIKAPFYPWNDDDDLYESNNLAILQRMRDDMMLEIKHESLPGVLRAQAAMQESILTSKRKRDLNKKYSQTTTPATDSTANSNQEQQQDQQEQESSEEANTYHNQVDEMINNTALIRNAYGESFLAHVVFRDEKGHPMFGLEADLTPEEYMKQQQDFEDTEKDKENEKEQVQVQEHVSMGIDDDGDIVDILTESQQNEGKGESEEEYTHSGVTDISRVHARLRGLCLTIPTGYWTYEWCYNNHIMQYHDEQVHKDNRVETYRTNEVDLGQFQSTRVERENNDNTNASAAITRLTETYVNGPMCDVGVKKVPRKATVTVQCCTSAMHDEHKMNPPDGMDHNIWYQIQSLIRAKNIPDDPMILHNPEDTNVQPAAVRTNTAAQRRGNEHLANYKGQHHPPHNTPHHSGALLDELAKEGQAPAATGSERYEHWGHLAGFMEPTLCNYQFIACVPLLCRRPGDGDGDADVDTDVSEHMNSDHSHRDLRKDHGQIWGAGHGEDMKQKTTFTSAAKPSDLIAVVRALQQQCLVRQAEWWTYEICFKTGIRQFHLHAEAVANKDKNKPTQTQMIVQGEFLLGKAPTKMYTNRAALEASVHGGSRVDANNDVVPDVEVGLPTGVLQRSYKPKILVLNFEDGTECDIENTKRASTVEVSCGPQDHITDIVEDRTCHYQVKIQSTVLCQFEGFPKPKQRTELIEFVPLEHQERHRFFLQDKLGVDEARAKGDKIRDLAKRKRKIQKDAARASEQASLMDQKVKQEQQRIQQKAQNNKHKPKPKQNKQQQKTKPKKHAEVTVLGRTGLMHVE